MKITINNTEINIKSKMRAILIYELLTNKAFNPQSITEIILYFYSLVLANAPEIQLTFTEFMDYLDDNLDVLNDFNEWILKESQLNRQFTEVKKKKEMQ